MREPLIIGGKNTVEAYKAAGSSLFPAYYDTIRTDLVTNGEAYTGHEELYVGYVFFGDNGARRKHCVKRHSLAMFLAVSSNVHLVCDDKERPLLVSCGDIMEFKEETDEEQAWKLWDAVAELRKDRWMGVMFGPDAV